MLGWSGKTGIESGPNGERIEVRGPLPDFGLVAWKGRRSLIAFDSNAAFNPKVSKAREDLAEFLTGQGASVWFVNVPEE